MRTPGDYFAALLKDGKVLVVGAGTDTNAKPALVHLNEGEKRFARSRNASILLKVDPVTVGSKHFVVGSEDLDPGERINVHCHDEEDELLILYRSVATVTLGDQHLSADAGTTVFVPAGTWIGIENTGKDSATVFFPSSVRLFK